MACLIAAIYLTAIYMLGGNERNEGRGCVGLLLRDGWAFYMLQWEEMEGWVTLMHFFEKLFRPCHK